jgi:hypothetical protein
VSATLILSQSVPCLLNAFPGWRQPVHCRLVADIGATGAPTARAGSTTPGVIIERDTTAQYTVSFPACRDLADINVGIYSTAPETQASVGYAVVDANEAETLATLGQFKFHVLNSEDGADDTDPADGDVMDITFWLDLG